ncbi:hypothetical protein OK016_28175 [Vibrio chagasii]|nr:hypothetical protein [Vibrio chagasii]
MNDAPAKQLAEVEMKNKYISMLNTPIGKMSVVLDVEQNQSEVAAILRAQKAVRWHRIWTVSLLRRRKKALALITYRSTQIRQGEVCGARRRSG